MTTPSRSDTCRRGPMKHLPHSNCNGGALPTSPVHAGSRPSGWDEDKHGPWVPVGITEHDAWFWEYNAGMNVHAYACRACGAMVGRGDLYTRLHINSHLGKTNALKWLDPSRHPFNEGSSDAPCRDCGRGRQQHYPYSKGVTGR